jgi:polysaccharide pyruvyl transferase WcaK-like protein
VRYILKRSSVIIARDKESQKVAQELVGPEQEVLLSPDVAFSLEPVRPERIELDPPLSGPLPRGVVGLNVNGLMFNGGYTRNNMFGLKLDYAAFLPKLATALLADHSGELWLVSHTYAKPGNVESDDEASERLRDSLPAGLRSRLRLVTAEYDQHEIKWIIGQCDFFIGSRMHSCIAALSQAVPCVGVAYSRKFAGVFESVGMAEWVVDGRKATNAQAVARVLELYRRRDSVRGELSRRADEARAQLREIFHKLLEGVKSGLVPVPA